MCGGDVTSAGAPRARPSCVRLAGGPGPLCVCGGLGDSARWAGCGRALTGLPSSPTRGPALGWTDDHRTLGLGRLTLALRPGASPWQVPPKATGRSQMEPHPPPPPPPGGGSRNAHVCVSGGESAGAEPPGAGASVHQPRPLLVCPWYR